MYKMRKVLFKDHPFLKNLELNFCDHNGKAVDTVIIAGKNGVGKSTILDVLYKVATHTVDTPLEVEFEKDDELFTLKYDLEEGSINKSSISTYVDDGKNHLLCSSSRFSDIYPFSGIFSDVDINFHADPVKNVTSMELDTQNESRRSKPNLASQIDQLIVDIQASDDADVAHSVREAPNKELPVSSLEYQERMPRFIDAFNNMFDELTYSHVENSKNTKAILFQKHGVKIPIENLSTGEKQIVYRGCFLLKDVNTMNGAFVFIDEPEISLHPTWQQKIMSFYKDIFTNEEGTQTSQIFAVTHSPFVIHNDNRYNDKVIVLAENGSGEITVKDKPTYYKCDSVEVVQDAFAIDDFNSEIPTVYLEGETDEKYFNRALEVFGYNVPFQFKWIGYKDKNGKAKNGGADTLKTILSFLRRQKHSTKSVFLFDCDCKKPYEDKDNVAVCTLPSYENNSEIKKGLENALVLDNINLDDFRKKNEKTDGYGCKCSNPIFQKVPLCEHICKELNEEELKCIFANLKTVIDELVDLFNGKDCSEFFSCMNGK